MTRDNALAETINGLYKTELINPHKPWRTIDEVEYATAKWVHWFNHHRLYESNDQNLWMTRGEAA
jgi:putative transposase